ncbi:hypothetical protein GH811_04680 [Acetobacterium malicum]|uniref:Restriction endonuclease type IV Mrr domain-containing protein n=1 Tax=Acetobacterium malicum TaxID=52692 RepID=A0ABR6YUN7_9FIRM|nr:hypothetical protein [Acetobacterium malicum]MBC3898907.1 hypothetical protein [Acetobacterium malicum]
MNISDKNHEKGVKTEELIAAYFRKLGFYVIRGIDYLNKNNKITDIDLWLYMSSSAISKEISIVDIKDRKKSHTYERILWTRGLQIAVGANHAIIVTTEYGDDIIKYGKKIDVTVLNGEFISKLKKAELVENRITDEDLDLLIKNNTFGKIDGDYRQRLFECKATLCDKISYDSINLILIHTNYFANQVIMRPKIKEIPLRLFYRCLSILCIAIDYVSKDLMFLEKSSRYKILYGGFTYGDGGIEKIDSSINQGLQLIEQYSGLKDFNPSVSKINILKVFEDLNTSIIAEYFSEINVLQNMFKSAIKFENMSMTNKELNTYDGDIELKSIIGSLLDFWKLDRKQFGLVKSE